MALVKLLNVHAGNREWLEPDLLLHVVAVGDEGGEFASLVQARPKQPGDLLDDRL